jgi:SSS family solute:Na+ symporter
MAFMDRVGVVFLLCLGLGVILSLLQKPAGEDKIVRLGDVSFKTGAGFNAGAVIVTAAIIAIYAFYW